MDKEIDLMKKKKIKKCQYGYIRHEKKKQFFFTLIAFCCCAGIFVLGLALNKFEKTNIFTIIAVLGMLPTVKLLIRYIVFFPYKSVSDTEYAAVISMLPNHAPTENLLIDCVFTTRERIMNLDFVVVTDHMVYGLVGKKSRKKADYIQKTEEVLTNCIRGWGFSNKIALCTDIKTFERMLKSYGMEYTVSGSDGKEDSGDGAKRGSDSENLIRELKVLAI